MTEVDLQALRVPFPVEYVGKLPRVTCKACSEGRCGEHKKAKCGTCDSYISERHIHLDYVGHADVTIRLLEVDPEWSWQPKATDPDPEMLRNAVASGDPEIVRMVIGNAPPKFERDRNGNPVGLWINLTVGGVTRLGCGSCPGNQNDAEKVLIGDALRNAAMRFGVAVDLWAKGDRANPTAENATASAGRAERGARGNAGDTFESAAPAGQVWRPRQPERDAPQARKPDLGDWGVRIDSIGSQEDADKVMAELREMHEAGKIDATRANAIWAAVKDKAAAARKAAAA